MEFLNSKPLKSAINKLLLIFIFYTVAAASFNGFFVKWKFRDVEAFNSFEMMYDETAERPYVYRQMMITFAKEIKSLTPKETQEKFINSLHPTDPNTKYVFPKTFIEYYNTNTKIEPRFEMEYQIIYFMTFIFLFLSMFLIREIGIEITGNSTAGTLTACIFAIIFPIFETVGGYFYDFGEIFFLCSAALLAIKGYWIAIILISPIAEYNKESFLFFIATLIPLIAIKTGYKKSFFVTAMAMLLSGLVYLYVKSLYVANDGGTIEIHLFTHLENIFNGWFNTEITYGLIFGARAFLPHLLIIAWIFKVTWKKLSKEWQNHIKIAAAISFPLYMFFCCHDEIRNFSLLYVGFIAMISIFIKDVTADKVKD